MKGKPWTVEEEKQLKDLVAAKTPLHVIAQMLHRRKAAITVKCRRLEIEVVVPKKKPVSTTTTIIPLPKELPSVEETLKMLAGALKSACTSGLTKVEVQRLRVLSQIARTYEVMLANFVNYREIEARIADMEKKYESLLREKTSDVAAQNNNE